MQKNHLPNNKESLQKQIEKRNKNKNVNNELNLPKVYIRHTHKRLNPDQRIH